MEYYYCWNNYSNSNSYLLFVSKIKMTEQINKKILFIILLGLCMSETKFYYPKNHINKSSLNSKILADLLKSKQISVSEVAYAVGFSNLSTFSTNFKNLHGESPKKFQDKHLK